MKVATAICLSLWIASMVCLALASVAFGWAVSP